MVTIKAIEGKGGGKVIIECETWKQCMMVRDALEDLFEVLRRY